MSIKNDEIISEKQVSLKLVYYLIYTYLLLKPFYFFSSGSIQISDIFIILAFGILFFCVIKNEEVKNMINKKISLLSIFVFFVIYISLIYSAIYLRYDFLISALFYIFNLMGIYVLYYCIRDINFLNTVKKICILNIILQFGMYLLNIGKWYGLIRYMGTFNDPNQFAFFIFSSLIIIYILEIILNNKKNYIIYLIASFLIYQSGSTGMLLGLSVFIACIIIYRILKSNLKRLLNYFIGILLFIIPCILIILLCTNNIDKKITEFISSNTVVDRIEEKFKRMALEDGNLLQERGYDKILNYPHKMILGAGHGYNERFEAYHTGEIHSTFPSILFYYGIIPFLILLNWIYKTIKYTPLSIKIAYFAVFIESLSLLNQRQLLFWFIILLGSNFQRKIGIENE